MIRAEPSRKGMWLIKCKKLDVAESPRFWGELAIHESNQGIRNSAYGTMVRIAPAPECGSGRCCGGRVFRLASRGHFMRQTRRQFVGTRRGRARRSGGGRRAPRAAGSGAPSRSPPSRPIRAKVAALRRGIAAMKALPASDHRSWFFWAATHAYSDALLAAELKRDPKLKKVDRDKYWNQCPHFGQCSADFVIWHRAYLHFFERVLRDAAGDPDAGAALLGLRQAGSAHLPGDLRAGIPRRRQDAAQSAVPSQPREILHQGPARDQRLDRRGAQDGRRRDLLPRSRRARLRRRPSGYRSHPDRPARAAAAQRHPSRGRRRDQLLQRRHGRDHHRRLRSGVLGASRQHRPHVGGVGEQARQELGTGAVARLVRREAVEFRRCRRQRSEGQPPRRHRAAGSLRCRVSQLNSPCRCCALVTFTAPAPASDEYASSGGAPTGRWPADRARDGHADAAHGWRAPPMPRRAPRRGRPNANCSPTIIRWSSRRTMLGTACSARPRRREAIPAMRRRAGRRRRRSMRPNCRTAALSPARTVGHQLQARPVLGLRGLSRLCRQAADRRSGRPDRHLRRDASRRRDDAGHVRHAPDEGGAALRRNRGGTQISWSLYAARRTLRSAGNP